MDFKNKEKKELSKIALQTEQLTENTARTEKSVIKEAPLNEGLVRKDINNLIKRLNALHKFKFTRVLLCAVELICKVFIQDFVYKRGLT